MYWFALLRRTVIYYFDSFTLFRVVGELINHKIFLVLLRF